MADQAQLPWEGLFEEQMRDEYADGGPAGGPHAPTAHDGAPGLFDHIAAQAAGGDWESTGSSSAADEWDGTGSSSESGFDSGFDDVSTTGSAEDGTESGSEFSAALSAPNSPPRDHDFAPGMAYCLPARPTQIAAPVAQRAAPMAQAARPNAHGAMNAVPPPPGAPPDWREPHLKREAPGGEVHHQSQLKMEPGVGMPEYLLQQQASLGMAATHAPTRPYPMPTLPAQQRQQAGTRPVQQPAQSQASAPIICPLCERQCESHHRLGFFWRKFGYDGPAYCSRCSSVFRAHMVTRTVSNDKCSRDEPCERCEKILAEFRVSKTEAFASMNSCVAKKPQVEKAPAPTDTSACPHCADVVPASTLGLFWRKFGYSGLPYCANCSARFRNHIIRQRSTKTKDCARNAPCGVCDNTLQSFGTDRETTFALIDSKSRAPPRASGSGGGGGAHNPAAIEALAAKRRKLNDCKLSTGALGSALPLAIIGMIAFCAVTGLVALSSTDDSSLMADLSYGGAQQNDAAAASPGAGTWCTGYSGSTRGMATAEVYACHGPTHSICAYQCLGAYVPFGNLTCLPGDTVFTGGMCVPDVDAARQALALSAMHRHMATRPWPDWCKSHALRGMIIDGDDEGVCFGPPLSTCDYHCRPGYVANGTHMCHAGQSVFSGGDCVPDYESVMEILALSAMHRHYVENTSSASSGSADPTDAPPAAADGDKASDGAAVAV